MKYLISNASSDEIEIIEKKLSEFNESNIKIIQKKAYVPFLYMIKDEEEIIAGISAYSSLYKIGYIDTLYVHEEYRNKGLGKMLIEKVEKDLRDFGCNLIHLETFDFQAPDFYLSMGYEVFGELYHKQIDTVEFFMKKHIES